jgi:alpha-L-fucosidase
MVAKHHDGFCNWFTGQTEHSVKNSPKPVDVLEAVSKACTDANLNMGLYLSPWDVNSPAYGVKKVGSDQIDPWPYNSFYMNQLKEILDPAVKKYGNGGKFVQLWMDGARAGGYYQPYFFDTEFLKEVQALRTGFNFDDIRLQESDTWFGVIRAFNPDMIIFSPAGTEVRWPATESGMLKIPVWSKIDPAKQRQLYIKNEEKEGVTPEGHDYLAHGDPNGSAWSIAEADTSILMRGWFETSNKRVKSLRALGDIYFESVGRGAVLLLNFAPGKNGLLSDIQVSRAKEFGDAIKDTFKTNLAKGAKASATSHRGGHKKYAPGNVLDGEYDTYWTLDDGQTTGAITIDLGQNKTFDVVSIQEYIPLGQRVAKFKVEVYDGSWKPFGDPSLQQTIGYKALVRGAAVTASRVRITREDSQAEPVINSVGVYKTAVKDFEAPSAAST